MSQKIGTSKNMKMSALFKLVRDLPLAVMAFTLVATTPSLAEEITLTTTMTKQDAGDTIVFGGLELEEELIFDASNDPVDTYIPFYDIPWTAPRGGIVLIKWHHPGVRVWPRPVPGSPASGDLSFSIKLDDATAVLGTTQSFTNIARLLATDFFYSPIIDIFTVDKGELYIIKLQYLAQNFVNCKVSLLNGPGKGSIIEIEYLSTIEIQEDT